MAEVMKPQTTVETAAAVNQDEPMEQSRESPEEIKEDRQSGEELKSYDILDPEIITSQ